MPGKCARSTSGILRTRRGSLKTVYHLELLYLSNIPFTDADTGGHLEFNNSEQDIMGYLGRQMQACFG